MWNILTRKYSALQTQLLLPERTQTKIQLHYSIFIIYNKNTWLNIISFLSVCLVTASQRSYNTRARVIFVSSYLSLREPAG